MIGVWVGRADGTSVAELTGRNAAAPLLFRLFEVLKQPSPLAKPLPPKTVIADARLLPPTLRHFGPEVAVRDLNSRMPQIMFPPDGAKLDRAFAANGDARPIVMKMSGGTAPYMVLVNGKPVDKHFRTGLLDVDPGASGYAKLTVVDATGQTASVNVFID